MDKMFLWIFYHLLLSWPSLAVPMLGGDRHLTTIRNFHLEETYKAYSNCVVHVVDFTGNLEIPPSSFPLIVDMRAPELRLVGKIVHVHELQDAAKLLARDRIRKIVSDKMQHFSCFVTFVAGNSTFVDILRQFTPSKKLFSFLLRQDFALGFSTHQAAWKGAADFFSATPIYFPQSAIVFIEGFELSANRFRGWFTPLELVLYPIATHVPTILLILVTSKPALLSADTGYSVFQSAFFYCWYCAEEFQSLDCADAVAKAENRANELANQVPWLDIQRQLWYSQRYLCPYTLAKRTEITCSREETNVAGVAFSKSNFSLSSRTSSGSRLPAVVLSAHMTDAEIVAPTEDLGFGLITSDGLYLPESLTFRPLVQPFHKNVWISIAIVMIFFALAVTGLNSKGDHLSRFLPAIYTALMVLVDQGHIPAPKRQPEHGVSQAALLKVYFTWGLWLLAAKLLTSYYNAQFNSSYILEPSYSRNWTGGLLAMDNFTILIGFDELSLKSSYRQKYNGKELLQWGACHDVFGVFDISSSHSFRDVCSLDSKVTQIMSDSFYMSYFGIISHKLGVRGTVYVRYVPMSRIRPLILYNLTVQKTVFVSPANYFDSDWQYFREAMRSNKGITFARYLDANDDMRLKWSRSYGYTRGLHHRLKDLVPRRLKAVVSSGILGNWREWANLRVTFHESRKSATKTSFFLPLSLTGSDVYMIFQLFALLMIGSASVYLIETCVFYRCLVPGFARSCKETMLLKIVERTAE